MYEGQIVDELQSISEAMTTLGSDKEKNLIQTLNSIEYHLRVLAACATGYLFHMHSIEIKTPDDVEA